MEEQVQDTRDDASLEPRAKCRRRRPECAAREPYALACSTLLTKQRRTNVNVRFIMLIRVMLIRVMLLVGLCGVVMAHTSNCSGDFNLRSHTLAPNRGEKSLMINNAAHFFQLPSPANSQGKNSTICIPQKNGNRNWGGFAFAAWRRRAPASIDAMLKDMRHWERHSLTVDDTIQEYIFARDPYTRLLSLYLQKVVSECTSDGQLGCSQGLRYLGLSKNTSFAYFVQHVWRLTEGNPRRLCVVDHHLCSQLESCYSSVSGSGKHILVLKLEEQAKWWPCFVKEVGVDESVLRGVQWLPFSGQECFYSPTGRCSDILTAISDQSQLLQIPTGNVHATFASSPEQLAKHYDQHAAWLVTLLYSADLAVLGYSAWSGMGARVGSE